MDQETLFTLLGGLGIFLFGITFMGEGLKNAAGDKLRDIIVKFTGTPFRGIILGIVLTGLLQSSSGSTALVIGLVIAGLMTFKQAIGVMFGANIGTTITAFLIGFKMSEYAMPVIAIGAFGYMFITSGRKKAVCQSFLGFGLLFLGMSLMGDALKPMAKEQWFTDIIRNASSNPVTGMLTATVMTILVQSSSASIGIAQSLVEQDLLSLKDAIPIALGANVGTTITAVLAAIGASKAAKRTATVHVTFNLIAAGLALIVLVPFTAFSLWLTEASGAGNVMGVAFAHGIFNFVAVFIFMWFIPQFAKFAYLLFPMDESEKIDPTILNYNLIITAPSMALEDARQSLIGMAKLSARHIEHTTNYLVSKDKVELKTAQSLETAIDAVYSDLRKYLSKLAGASLNNSELKEYHALLMSAKDIERIGDYCENLTEEFSKFINAKIRMSQDAWDDLSVGLKAIKEMVDKTIKLLDTYDAGYAGEIRTLESNLDKLEEEAKRRHVERLSNGDCSHHEKINYQKIWSDIERIGDHTYNVARYFRKLDNASGIKK